MSVDSRAAGRMKILHTEASTGWGGQEIRILNEAAGMIARGHQVELACPADARICIEAPRRGVPVHALSIGRKNLRGLSAMRRFLRTHSYDVINTHSSTDSWLVALASIGLRGGHDDTRDTRDTASAGTAGRRGPPPLVRTRHISALVPGNAATRWLYTHASTHVVTTGESLREQLIRDNGLDPHRVTSVPTGIDPSRFPPTDDAIRALRRIELSLDPRTALVGIVATLRSWKGHRYLIDAIADLDDDTVRLAIIGDGPQRAALEQQVAARKLEDRIVFAGNRDDVSPWLQAFDVFALPSYANEGVPQALLQAMFTGLPCVTTDAGAISEIAIDGTTALVVEREDPVTLAAALARLLADAPLRQQLGSAARAHVLERHSLAGMLDRMESIFASAMSGPAPGRRAR